MTSIQTPFGLMQLMTLPMGWTNLVPIFHNDVTYILQAKIPERTIPYVDDCTLKGPPFDYKKEDGTYETIPENPGIRRFVREHADTVNRVCTRMANAGGTFSGPKAQLIKPRITALGWHLTPEGRIPPPDKVEVIKNWVDCRSLSEV